MFKVTHELVTEFLESSFKSVRIMS